MKALALKVLNHFRYPSTWLGLVSLATAAGISLTEAQTEAVVAAGMAAAGVIGAFVGFSDSDIEDK